jgi:probable rRNA maturation factor
MAKIHSPQERSRIKMSSEKTDITVEITGDCPDLEAGFDRFRQLADLICKRFKTARATVSIAIVDDEVIKKVNKEFLNESHKTDVISFDLSDETDAEVHFELIVNADEAARQAQTRNHSIEAEIALYITHGLLHNLGFDDGEDDHSRTMHKMEDEILVLAGFGPVYSD